MDTTNEGSLVNMDSLRRVEEILWILSRMLEAQNNEVFYFPSLDNDIEQLHTDEATYQKLRDAVDHLSRDIDYPICMYFANLQPNTVFIWSLTGVHTGMARILARPILNPRDGTTTFYEWGPLSINLHPVTWEPDKFLKPSRSFFYAQDGVASATAVIKVGFGRTLPMLEEISRAYLTKTSRIQAVLLIKIVEEDEWHDDTFKMYQNEIEFLRTVDNEVVADENKERSFGPVFVNGHQMSNMISYAGIAAWRKGEIGIEEGRYESFIPNTDSGTFRLWRSQLYPRNAYTEDLLVIEKSYEELRKEMICRLRGLALERYTRCVKKALWDPSTIADRECEEINSGVSGLMLVD